MNWKNIENAHILILVSLGFVALSSVQIKWTVIKAIPFFPFSIANALDLLQSCT